MFNQDQVADWSREAEMADAYEPEAEEWPADLWED